MRSPSVGLAVVLAVIGLVLLGWSEPAFACITGYCQDPPIGTCLGSLCSVDYGYAYSEIIQGCGVCERWFCDWFEECLFGGGCNCSCFFDTWWDFCIAIEV